MKIFNRDYLSASVLMLAGFFYVIIIGSGICEYINPIKSIEINDGDVLILRSDYGIAAVQFTKFDIQKAFYRWKFISTDTEEISKGEGEVYEVYEMEYVEDKDYKVIDRGSKLQIKAGKFLITWSYASLNSGWIYYDTSEIEIKVIKNKKFDEIDLKKFR